MNAAWWNSVMAQAENVAAKKEGAVQDASTLDYLSALDKARADAKMQYDMQRFRDARTIAAGGAGGGGRGKEGEEYFIPGVGLTHDKESYNRMSAIKAGADKAGYVVQDIIGRIKSGETRGIVSTNSFDTIVDQLPIVMSELEGNKTARMSEGTAEQIKHSVSMLGTNNPLVSKEQQLEAANTLLKYINMTPTTEARAMGFQSASPAWEMTKRGIREAPVGAPKYTKEVVPRGKALPLPVKK